MLSYPLTTRKQLRYYKLMRSTFTYTQFSALFPDDESCLDEIRRLRYPKGIFCSFCNKKTIHYNVKGRTSYLCKKCRTHIYPLKGTIFEKTTTPLRVWFYAFFLMIHTRSHISIIQLQKELGVTYKTAWRIYKLTRKLMEQKNGDLLSDTINNVHRWVFFNKIEFKVVEKRNKVNR